MGTPRLEVGNDGQAAGGSDGLEGRLGRRACLDMDDTGVGGVFGTENGSVGDILCWDIKFKGLKRGTILKDATEVCHHYIVVKQARWNSSKRCAIKEDLIKICHQWIVVE